MIPIIKTMIPFYINQRWRSTQASGTIAGAEKLRDAL